MDKFSPALALGGIGALLLGIWGLLGGPDITNSGTALWSTLAVAVAVGFALIFSGGRPDKTQQHDNKDTESAE